MSLASMKGGIASRLVGAVAAPLPINLAPLPFSATSSVVVAAPLRIVVVGKGPASGPASGSAAIAPDSAAAAAIEAFLRSVRVGHPAANVNVDNIDNAAAGSSGDEKDRVRIAMDEMRIEPAIAMGEPSLSPVVGSSVFPEGSALSSSGSGADRPRLPVPMTPEGEFEIPTLMEEMMMEMKEAEKEVEAESRKFKAWLDGKLGEHVGVGAGPGMAECRVLKPGSMKEKMEEMNDWVRSVLGLAAVERLPLCSPDAAVTTGTATIVRGKKMLPPPLPIDLPFPGFVPSSRPAASANVAGVVPP
ncbi:hypothetical protein FRC17_001799, partial [Serendipita sp. 399]